MAAPKSPAKPSAEPAQGQINPKLVRQLADILRETELTEIEVEKGGLRIRVARELTVAAAPAVALAPAVHAAPAAPAFTPGPAAPAPASMPSDPAATPAPAGEQVKSPMVGTVYLQATPGADPFVKPGDTVKAGQTLLIIEAMKTMNQIPAPRAGVVRRILVGDGSAVEYGAPLMIIE